MAASTVPAFKQALVAALQAATWPVSNPQVSYGPPRNETREDVIVGDTAQEGGAERQWAALGNRSIDEEYALNLWVIVTNPGDTCKAATDRAFALYDVVQSVLRTTPGLGVTGITASSLAQAEHTESLTDEGFVCTIESAVRVTARI